MLLAACFVFSCLTGLLKIVFNFRMFEDVFHDSNDKETKLRLCWTLFVLVKGIRLLYKPCNKILLVLCMLLICDPPYLTFLVWNWYNYFYSISNPLCWTCWVGGSVWADGLLLHLHNERDTVIPTETTLWYEVPSILDDGRNRIVMRISIIGIT